MPPPPDASSNDLAATSWHAFSMGLPGECLRYLEQAAALAPEGSSLAQTLAGA